MPNSLRDPLVQMQAHGHTNTLIQTNMCKRPAKNVLVSLVGDQGVEVGCLLVILASRSLQGALLRLLHLYKWVTVGDIVQNYTPC